MEIVLALTTGFGFGALLAAVLIGGRYVRALEQLRDIAPAAAGQVYVPPVIPDGTLEPTFDQATVDRGAKAIQEELAGQGRHIGWEDAQAQARAMLAETLPVMR